MQNDFEIMDHEIQNDTNVCAAFRIRAEPMRFNKPRVRQISFKSAQNRIEALDMTYLQNQLIASSRVSQFRSMRSVVGDWLFHEHVFAIGEKRPRNVIMRIRGRSD